MAEHSTSQALLPPRREPPEQPSTAGYEVGYAKPPAKSRRRLQEEWFDTALTDKIEWQREPDRRARLGITDLPPPLPHPDHIVIDMRTGTANIRGPATKEEMAKWDEWLSHKAGFEAEREELRAMLADPACEHRQIVEEELASTEKVLEILGRLTRA
jgi:hypothetical protein